VANKYGTDLKESLHDLLSMIENREKLEISIAKQKRRIAALYELVETEEGNPLAVVDGITDACKTVFRASDKPLSATEVRDKVLSLGLPSQANLLASIHTVIRRLKEAKEIMEVPGTSPTAYKWPNPWDAAVMGLTGTPAKEGVTTLAELLTDNFLKSYKADRIIPPPPSPPPGFPHPLIPSAIKDWSKKK
jgi:hypothetical protein